MPAMHLNSFLLRLPPILAPRPLISPTAAGLQQTVRYATALSAGVLYSPHGLGARSRDELTPKLDTGFSRPSSTCSVSSGMDGMSAGQRQASGAEALLLLCGGSDNGWAVQSFTHNHPPPPSGPVLTSNTTHTPIALNIGRQCAPDSPEDGAGVSRQPTCDSSPSRSWEADELSSWLSQLRPIFTSAAYRPQSACSS
jgi:hypothetical protein